MLPLLQLSLLSLACAGVIHVSPGPNALSDSFGAASAGDVIEMAAGVYSGSGNCGLTLAKPNVKLIGASTATLDCASPMVVAASGCIIHGVRFVNGVSGCLLITGYNVLVYGSEFVGCSTASNGGAISIRSALTTLDHVIVSSSTATGHGGAVYAQGAVNIADSFFRNNTAGGSGGAVYVGGGSSSISGWSVFVFNTATANGGAIYVLDNWLRLSGDVRCSSNTAVEGNGGCVCTSGANLTISDRVLIEDNAASFLGGGVYTPGPAPSAPSVTVQDQVVFRGNRGSIGGGLAGRIIYASGSVLFDGNSAQNGAGVAGWGNSIRPAYVSLQEQCTIRNNRAETSGGGLYCFAYTTARVGGRVLIDSNSAGFGGGVWAGLKTDVLVNGDVELRGNSASSGGGLYVDGGFTGTRYEPGMLSVAGNAVIRGNEAKEFGGGLYGHASKLTISGSVRLEQNLAGIAGGGITSLQATLLISDRVVIRNNTAAVRGGGAFLSSTTLEAFRGVNVANISGSVLFAQNRALGDGGGIATQDSHLSVRGNVSFRGNLASSEGGGLSLLRIEYATLNHFSGDVEISGNSARSAGGVLTNNTELTVACCARIFNNFAREDGGGFKIVGGSWIRAQGVSIVANAAVKHGGGAYLDDTSQLELQTVKVLSNTADLGGGVAALASARCNASLGTLIEGNRARLGGGAAVLDSATLTVDGSHFANNVASEDGGGIFGQGFVAVGRNSSVRSCSAVRGGAVFSTGVGIQLGSTVDISLNSALSDGAGVFTFGPVMLGATVRDNVAGKSGGGLFASGADARITVPYDAAVVIENNVAAVYGGGMYFEEAANFVVSSEACQCSPNARGDGVCDFQCMTRGCNWDNGDCNARYTAPDVDRACDRKVCPADFMFYSFLVGDCYGDCFTSSCDWSRQLCQGQRAALSQCPLFDLAVYISAPAQAYAIAPSGPRRCASRECDNWREPVVQFLDDLNVFVTNSSELQKITRALTMEIWVKGNTLVSSRYVDLVVSDTSVELWFRNGSTCSELRTKAFPSGWVHVAVVLDDPVRVYVDGLLLKRAGGTCESGHPFFGGPLTDVYGYPIPGTSDSFVSDQGFTITGLVSLVSGFRLWDYGRSQTQIQAYMSATCAQAQPIVCYQFGDSSVVMDQGTGEATPGYMIHKSTPRCTLAEDGILAPCLVQKPYLPSMGVAYNQQDVARTARLAQSMDAPTAQKAFPGCAWFPLTVRGNSANFGGGVYQAGCNSGLDGHGVCFLSGMAATSGAALVSFEHNHALTSGGAVFTDCAEVLPTCKAMLSSRLGAPGLGAKIHFGDNTAGGYGPNVATTPSRLTRAKVNKDTYVPGQETLSLSLTLLDGLGTVVSGNGQTVLPHVLVLLFCQQPAGCDFQTALRAPHFLTMDVDVFRTTGITIVCPDSARVYAYFYLSANLSNTVPLLCRPCQPGQQRVHIEAYWSCASCLPAQYIVDPNNHTCRKCPLGATCNGSGLVGLDGSTWASVGSIYRLRSCPAGYVLIRDDSSNCLTGINSDDCKTGPELDHCFRCPGSPAPGRFSLVEATYPGGMVSPTEAAVTQCRPCPAGANCEGGGSSVVPLPGYWTAAQRRVVGTDPAMYKCLPDLCTGNNQCSEGHAGFVCGVCKDNYTHSGTQCIVCGSEESLHAGRIAALAVLAVAFLGSWVFVSIHPFMAMPTTPAPSRRASVVDDLRERFQKLASKIKSSQLPVVMGILKILMTFYQVTSCFWTAFDVPWPRSLDDFFRGSTVTKGDVFTIPSFACLSRDWSRGDRLLFYTVTPPIVTLLWGVPLAVAVLTRKSAALKALKAKFFNATLVFLFLVYPMCSIAVLDIYNCTRIESMYWLTNDLRLTCPMFTSASWLFVWTIICTVAFPFGIPVLMLLGLYYFDVPRMAKQKTDRAALSAMLAKFQNDHRQAIRESSNTDVSVCALILNAIDRRAPDGVWQFFRNTGPVTLEAFMSVLVHMHAELQLVYDEATLRADAVVLFRHFDVDDNGELAEKEFAVLTCALVEAWQEDLSDAQIDALIHHTWEVHATETRPWLANILPSKPVGSRQRLLRHCAYLRKEQLLSVSKCFWNEADDAPEDEKLAINCVGFLFLSFRVEYWYFEIIEQVRKLLMTSVIVVFYPGSLVQLTGGIFITFIGLIMCFVSQPYLQRQLNDLQAACLSIQGVTLFYGVFLIAENTGANTAQETVITQLILAANIMVAFVPLLQFFVLRPPPFGQRPMWERALNIVWTPKETVRNMPVELAFYDAQAGAA